MKTVILFLFFLVACNNTQVSNTDGASEKTKALVEDTGLVIGDKTDIQTARPVISNPDPATKKPNIEELKTIAANSSCARYFWQDRGRPKVGYIQGVALVYARFICDRESEIYKIVSAPASSNEVKDVLAHYQYVFQANDMQNTGGVDTVRHVFTLLFGLGMRESSGRYCCGRDMSANFSSADSAEAGVFQASYGSRRASPEFQKLYEKYKANPAGCFLGTFSQGYVCREGDLKNWGTGEGVNWQRLTKECPAFATEWAALLVRLSGGRRAEFGPLRTFKAEVRPECDDMLKAIEKKVLMTDGFCAVLKGHK